MSAFEILRVCNIVKSPNKVIKKEKKIIECVLVVAEFMFVYIPYAAVTVSSCKPKDTRIHNAILSIAVIWSEEVSYFVLKEINRREV